MSSVRVHLDVIRAFHSSTEEVLVFVHPPMARFLKAYKTCFPVAGTLLSLGTLIWFSALRNNLSVPPLPQDFISDSHHIGQNNGGTLGPHGRLAIHYFLQ